MPKKIIPQDVLEEIKDANKKIEQVNDSPNITEYEYFHTGSYSLDRIISVKDGQVGIPAPCIIELSGPHSTAKTTLSLEMIRNVLEDLNGFAWYCDAEKRLNDGYAEILLGDNIESLVKVKTRIVQQAFWKIEESCRKLIKSDLQDVPAIYVIDSLGVLDDENRYKKDVDGNYEAKYHAVDFGSGKAIKRCLGFAWEVVSRTNGIILLINHEHDKIDLTGFGSKFSKKVTPGGVNKDYMAGVKLSVNVKQTLKSKGRKSGAILRVRNMKSSIDMPYGEAEFEVKFGEGIDREKDIYDTAKNLKLIEKSGNRFYFDGEEIGSRDKAIDKIYDDISLRNELIEAIKNAPADWEEEE
jgi:recombination protein RecA